MRVLLDNNVFVSGLFSRAGPPAQLVDAVLAGSATLISSAPQLERLAEVLARAKHADRFSAADGAELLRAIAACGDIVEPALDITATSDPEDNLILGAALAGKAELIVTGDKRHLLPLQEFEGIPIVTPAEALVLLKAQ